MRKTLLMLFSIFTVINFFGNEKETVNAKNCFNFRKSITNKKQSFLNFNGDNLTLKETTGCKTGNYNNLILYAAPQVNKSKIQTKVQTKKTMTTNKQKAAIAVNTIGVVCLLTGAALLASSLAYSNHLENGDYEFESYKTGKNTARGLFYGSTAGFGTGAVCITVSIPLFIEKKNANIKKTNKSNSNIKNKPTPKKPASKKK